MAPVIRITDEVYTRLQRLAEPFVDTPATVIERLLNAQEGERRNVAGKENGAIATSQLRNYQPELWEQTPCNNLFLAPGNKTNLDRSILQSVQISDINQLLTPEQRGILRNTQSLRCFALKEHARTNYNAMRPGDLVLFSENGSGKFKYASRIQTTFENASLGKLIWRDPQWKLIYLLNPQQTWITDLNKPNTLEKCGYDRNFWLPGFIQVSAEVVVRIKRSQGSFAGFLAS
ncbi:MAG: hypothetical protein SGI88_14080 [Candidatus Hydrogenedentes bacterium]|nr:hypothetical protein [Candidatus Hydrogenedentota bacterium]